MAFPLSSLHLSSICLLLIQHHFAPGEMVQQTGRTWVRKGTALSAEPGPDFQLHKKGAWTLL